MNPNFHPDCIAVNLKETQGKTDDKSLEEFFVNAQLGEVYLMNVDERQWLYGHRSSGRSTLGAIIDECYQSKT